MLSASGPAGRDLQASKLRRLPTHGEPLGLVLPWSRSVSEGENSRGDCVVNTSRPPESKSECGVRRDGGLQTVARRMLPVYTAGLCPTIGGGLHRPTGAARLKRERGAKPLRSRHCDGRGAIADATHEAARNRGEGASARSSPQSGDLPWAETSVAPRGWERRPRCRRFHTRPGRSCPKRPIRAVRSGAMRPGCSPR